jgi:hypothetical protein
VQNFEGNHAGWGYIDKTGKVVVWTTAEGPQL